MSYPYYGPCDGCGRSHQECLNDVFDKGLVACCAECANRKSHKGELGYKPKEQ